MSAIRLDLVLAAIGLATATATMAGGVLALRLTSTLGLLLAFASGAVVGVALFDLLPEALELGRASQPASVLTAAAAVGFAVYFTIDRMVPVFTAGKGRHRGHLGAAALTLHSLMDGLGIGFAFQASAAAGVVVAFAVLAHDLVDGLNTVTLGLSGGLERKTARRWLVADAAAPLVGIGVSRLVTLPQPTLALLLAVFAGFFLYIGASELLPHSQNQTRRTTTVLLTLLGLALIYAVVKLAAASSQLTPVSIARRTRSAVRATPSLDLIWLGSVGDGLVADAERLGDLGQAGPAGQQAHDLQLAGAERIRAALGAGAAAPAPGRSRAST